MIYKPGIFFAFFFFFLAALGLYCCAEATVVAVPRVLTAVASLVVKHGLSFSAACGIFPDHGSNPCSLHC